MAKMRFLFIRIGATVSKVMGILSNLMIPAHQIWSYPVTQDANFENILFCLNSTFNIRKSHKIPSGKALHFRSYQQKSHRGGRGKQPPVPLGLGKCHFLPGEGLLKIGGSDTFS